MTEVISNFLIDRELEIVLKKNVKYEMEKHFVELKAISISSFGA